MMAAAGRKCRPRKKRTGRRNPSFATAPLPPPQQPRRTLRPRRRRPLLDDFADFDDYFVEEDEDLEEDEELERKRRKLKLVLKLPHNPPPATTANASKLEPNVEKEEQLRRFRSPPRSSPSSSSSSSAAPSSSYVDDDEEGEESIKPPKKRWLEGGGDEDPGGVSDGYGDRKRGSGNVVRKTKVLVSGTSVVGTPLPERKLLEAILDKIQKKDTYGVFAEPVDLEELPDYHDVIEHPMDFGTVRKKLANNAYCLFEHFEDDVFLICSNAMQYNAPDTIYFRQARSMQDLGRKEFQKLRAEGKCIENPKSDEKNRLEIIEKKPLQKSLPRKTQEPAGSDISSAATLASAGEVCAGLATAQANDARPPVTIKEYNDGSSSLDESKSEKVDELSVKDSPSMLREKSLVVDENRRVTYNISDQQPMVECESVFDILEGEPRQLHDVGLDAEYSYARSLARFAATLGPIAWKIASQKIESVLPSGVKFGPGWVGEYEPLPTPVLFLEKHSQKQPDVDSNVQFKLVVSKETEVGRKASVNGDARDARSLQSRIMTTTYNSGSDTAEKNIHGRAAEVKQQLFNVTSETQPIGTAAMLQQQEQANVNISKAKNNAMEQDLVFQRSSSSSTPVNQAMQQSEFCPQIAAFRSPGIISFDKKTLQPGPVTQMVARMPTCRNHGYGINASKLTNGHVSDNTNYNGLNNPTGFITKHQQEVVSNCSNPGSREHGTNDPSRLMASSNRMLDQSNISKEVNDLLKLFPAAVPPAAREISGTAAPATAQAWMSVGASSQYKVPVDGAGTREFQERPSATLYSSSWRTPNSSPKTFDGPRTTLISHAFRQPVQVVGLDSQVRAEGLVIFPQLVAADLLRSQGQTPWQGLVPQMQQKNDKNICPPDLNITFQPPASPVQQSSGIFKDSQQPDLALQL